MLKQICKCAKCGSILYQGRDNGKYYLDYDENEPLMLTLNKGWGYITPNPKRPSEGFCTCPSCREFYVKYYKIKDLFT